MAVRALREVGRRLARAPGRVAREAARAARRALEARDRERARRLPRAPLPENAFGEKMLRFEYLPREVRKWVAYLQKDRARRAGVYAFPLLVAAEGAVLAAAPPKWLRVLVAGASGAHSGLVLDYWVRRKKLARKRDLAYRHLVEALARSQDLLVRHFLQQHELVYIDGRGNLVGATRERFLKRWGFRRVRVHGPGPWKAAWKQGPWGGEGRKR